jgi:hypothetical protein
MRFVVIDLAEDPDATPLWGRRGRLIDSFQTDESARALALHRMALGDVEVVVIDGVSGDQVFPDPKAASAAETPSSETRLIRKRGQTG